MQSTAKEEPKGVCRPGWLEVDPHVCILDNHFGFLFYAKIT